MSPPVLLLIFNRPATTKIVAEAIAAAKPESLFVAADGPRPNKKGEKELCDAARNAVLEIDWQCDVQTRFGKENQGCAVSVSESVSWFFKNCPSGIILEDDCVPDPSFFPFCSEMLSRYADEPRIGCITGDYFCKNDNRIADSYFFSKYPHCWGWASWARAWECFDFSMAQEDLSDKDLLSQIGCSPDEVQFWKSLFSKTRCGSLDTWDNRWARSLWLKNMATITPNCNLVENIGFGPDATHTKGWNIYPDSTAIKFPLKHPLSISINREADRDVFRNIYNRRLIARVVTRYGLHRFFQRSPAALFQKCFGKLSH